MSSNKLPVVAAIPNYNMADSLAELLPQLATQDYADIFVLDDASTDHSRQVVTDFNANIEFVAGKENVGSGPNRNRILGALGYDAIIHFIDADMDLETENVPELAQDIMPSEQLGFVGGLLKNLDGKQHPFNYGPRQCLRTDVLSHLQLHVNSVAKHDPEHAKAIRERYKHVLADWPDPLTTPKPRQVFWSAESNLLIRADVFAGIGGYDPKLREHEIQDLAMRMHDKGLERRFDPSLAAVHKAVMVRTGNRNMQMAKAELQIAKKHGFRNFLLPDGTFKPEL